MQIATSVEDDTLTVRYDPDETDIEEYFPTPDTPPLQLRHSDVIPWGQIARTFPPLYV